MHLLMKKEYEIPEADEVRMDVESAFLGSTTGGDDPIVCTED